MEDKFAVEKAGTKFFMPTILLKFEWRHPNESARYIQVQ